MAAPNDYIKFEVWNDHWWFKPSFEVDLSTLTEIDFYPWTREKNHTNLIRLEIADNNQPTLQQVNALQFIITHQQQIRHGIFDYHQKVILPVFRAFNRTTVELKLRITERRQAVPSFSRTTLELKFIMNDYRGYSELANYFLRAM